MTTLTYPDLALHEVMRETARRYPNRTAIWFDGAALTFAEFEAESNRLANGLQQLGLANGDRIGLFLPNSPEYELGFYAASKTGAVACPLNPSYRSTELTYILNDSGSTVLLTHTKLLPFVEAIRNELPTLRTIVVVGPETAQGKDIHGYRDLVARHSAEPPSIKVQPEQLAALPYSSGTTGRPKGVMLSHRNLVWNQHQFAKAGRFCPDDNYLVFLPLSHIYGIALMGIGMLVGLQQIVLERFDLAQVVRLIEQKSASWLHVVPPVLLALATAPEVERSQLRSLKYVLNAAACVAPDVARRFEDRFGVPVIQAYGLTEASPLTHHSPLEPERIKMQSGGVPAPDTEHRVVDLETGESTLAPGEVGEIIVRGPQVMQGYWNAPQETAVALRHGWLYTGDVGWIDDEGYVFISDRKKEMIKYKAFSIAPAELEAVLFAHPHVADCGVVGVPDDEAGEIPMAFVVPRAGVTLDTQALAQFVAERVAGYKQVRRWVLVEKVPRTPSGKILRRFLKELPTS